MHVTPSVFAWHAFMIPPLRSRKHGKTRDFVRDRIPQNHEFWQNITGLQEQLFLYLISNGVLSWNYSRVWNRMKHGRSNGVKPYSSLASSFNSWPSASCFHIFFSCFLSDSLCVFHSPFLYKFFLSSLDSCFPLWFLPACRQMLTDSCIKKAWSNLWLSKYSLVNSKSSLQASTTFTANLI